MMVLHTPVIIMIITTITTFQDAKILECLIHKLIIMKETLMRLDFNLKVTQVFSGYWEPSANLLKEIMRLRTFGLV